MPMYIANESYAHIVYVVPKLAICWSAVKGFGDAIPEPYRTMLEAPAAMLEHSLHPIPFDDGGVMFGGWVGDASFTVHGCLEAPCEPNLEHAVFVMSGADVRRGDLASIPETLTTQQSFTELIVQQLVSIHLVRTFAGWGVVHDDKSGRDAGSVGIQFNRKLMKDVFFSKESKDDPMAWFDSEIRGPRR